MNTLLTSNFDSVFSKKIPTVDFSVPKEVIDKDKELVAVEESFVENVNNNISRLVQRWYSENKKDILDKKKSVLESLDKVLASSKVFYQQELWKLWNLSFFLGETHGIREIEEIDKKGKFSSSNNVVQFGKKEDQEEKKKVKERDIRNREATTGEIQSELERATKRKVSPELLQRNKFGQTYLQLRNDQITNDTNRIVSNQIKEAVATYFNSSGVDKEGALLRSISGGGTDNSETDSRLKLVNEVIYRTQQQTETKINSNRDQIRALTKEKESNKRRIESSGYTDDKIEDLRLDLATEEYIRANPSQAKELRRSNLRINNEIEKYKNTLVYRLNNGLQQRIDKLEAAAEKTSGKEYVFGKNNEDSKKIFGEYKERASLEELYKAKAKISASKSKANYNYTHTGVAVTETSLGYNLGRLKRFQEEGITHVQWRTDREYIDKQKRQMPCDFCRDRNYKIVPIQYVFDSFNKALNIKNPANWSPPVHPFCACLLYPVKNVKEDKDDLRKLASTTGLGVGVLGALKSIQTANTAKENKETSKKILFGALGVAGGVLSVALAYKLFGKFLEGGKSLDVIKTLRESLPFFVKKSEIPKKTLARIPDEIKNVSRDLIDIESLSTYIDPKRAEFIANQIYKDVVSKGDGSTLSLADRARLKQIIDDYIKQTSTIVDTTPDLPELNLPLRKLELPQYEGVVLRNISEERLAANLDETSAIKPLEIKDKRANSVNVSSISRQKYSRIQGLIDQYKANLDAEITKNSSQTIDRLLSNGSSSLNQIDTQYNLLSTIRQNAQSLKFDIENSIYRLGEKLNSSNINPLVEGFYDADKNALSDGTKALLQSTFQKIKDFNRLVRNSDIKLTDKKALVEDLSNAIEELSSRATRASNSGDLAEQKRIINSLIQDYQDYVTSQSTSIDRDVVLRESLNINKLQGSLAANDTPIIDRLQSIQEKIGLRINQIEDTNATVETSGLKESISYAKSEIDEAAKLLNGRPYTLTYQQYLEKISDPVQRARVEQTYETRKELSNIANNISNRLETVGDNYHNQLERINELANSSLTNLINDVDIKETIIPNNFNQELDSVNELIRGNQNNPEGISRAREYLQERYPYLSSIEGSVFDENNKDQITKVYKDVIDKYSGILENTRTLEQLQNSTNGINSLDIDVADLNNISGIANYREALVKDLADKVKQDAGELKSELDSLVNSITDKKQKVTNKITWLKNIKSRVQNNINQSTSEYQNIVRELDNLINANQISPGTKAEILAGLQETDTNTEAISKIDLAINKLEVVKKGIEDREKLLRNLNIPTNKSFIPSTIEDSGLSDELRQKLNLNLNLGFSDDLLQSLSTIDNPRQTIKLGELGNQLNNIISTAVQTRKNKAVLLGAWEKLEAGKIKYDSFNELLKRIGFSVDQSGNKSVRLRELVENNKLNLSTNQREVLKSLTNEELETLIVASETGAFDLIKEYQQLQKQVVDLGAHSQNILQQVDSNYLQVLRQPPYNVDARIVFGEGGSVGLVTRELSPSSESPEVLLAEVRKRLGILEDGSNAPLIRGKKGISSGEELNKKIAEIVKSPENYIQSKYLQTELLNSMARIDDRLAVLNFSLSTRNISEFSSDNTSKFQQFNTNNTKIRLLGYNKIKLLSYNK